MDVLAGSFGPTVSLVRLSGEGGVADNLEIIMPGVDGQHVTLMRRFNDQTITVQHKLIGGGNIRLDNAASYALDTPNTTLQLAYNAPTGFWCQVGGTRIP